MTSITRQSLLSLAELCKQFGDYSNMMRYMSDLVELTDGGALTIEERKIYLGAAKLLIDFHRKRVVEMEHKELETKTDAERALIRNYLLRLYADLESACKSVLVTNGRLIRTHWALRRKDDSPNDIYLKPLVVYSLQEGDCYRYNSEVYVSGVKRDDGDLGHNTDRARKSYQFAWDNARRLSTLDVENFPTMLDVALNFSVFCSDIVSSPQESVDMANEALKEATPKLGKMSWTSHDSCKVMIATLKKNLPLWISAVKKKQPQG